MEKQKQKQKKAQKNKRKRSHKTEKIERLCKNFENEESEDQSSDIPPTDFKPRTKSKAGSSKVKIIAF
jgi:hypothetical protein